MRIIDFLQAMGNDDIVLCAKMCNESRGSKVNSFFVRAFISRFYRLDNEEQLASSDADVLKIMKHIYDNCTSLSLFYDCYGMSDIINKELGLYDVAGSRNLINIPGIGVTDGNVTRPSAIRLAKHSMHSFFESGMVDVMVCTPEDAELWCNKEYAYRVIDNMISSDNIWAFFYVLLGNDKIPEENVVEYFLRVEKHGDTSYKRELLNLVDYESKRTISIVAAYKRAGGDFSITNYGSTQIDHIPMTLRKDATHLNNILEIIDIESSHGDAWMWESCVLAKYVCENGLIDKYKRLFYQDYTACSFLPVEYIVNNFDPDKWDAVAALQNFYSDSSNSDEIGYDDFHNQAIEFYRKLLLAGFITPANIPRSVLKRIATKRFKQELKKTKPEVLVMFI